MKKLIVLLGPTGVGKTALSIELAQRYGCPIISSDSRQIYKGIEIGTAAPTAKEQALVKANEILANVEIKNGPHKVRFFICAMYKFIFIK